MNPGASAPESQRLSQTQRGYDRWSEIYDVDENPLVAIESPIMRQLIADVAGLDVLDVGCGTGRHTAFLVAAGARVTAIDFSAGMLEKAKSKPECSRVDFRTHELSQPFPFPDAAFDRIVCGLVIDHIRDLHGLFAEMRRVCRPRGMAAVSVMHPAMSLLGVEARFTDPTTGQKVTCGSEENMTADYVMAILNSGWRLHQMIEERVTDSLIQKLPRAAKYADWPLLLAFQLKID